MVDDVIDSRDTIVQPFRIRVFWSQTIVKSYNSHLARCSLGITESSTTVDAAKSPATSMQIQQDWKALVLTSLGLIKAHVWGNHFCFHMVRILGWSIPGIADSCQPFVISINSPEYSQCLFVL